MVPCQEFATKHLENVCARKDTEVKGVTNVFLDILVIRIVVPAIVVMSDLWDNFVTCLGNVLVCPISLDVLVINVALETTNFQNAYVSLSLDIYILGLSYSDLRILEYKFDEYL